AEYPGDTGAAERLQPVADAVAQEQGIDAVGDHAGDADIDEGAGCRAARAAAETSAGDDDVALPHLVDPAGAHRAEQCAGLGFLGAVEDIARHHDVGVDVIPEHPDAARDHDSASAV